MPPLTLVVMAAEQELMISAQGAAVRMGAPRSTTDVTPPEGSNNVAEPHFLVSGNAPGQRHLRWNIVSSRPRRIAQAADD